MNRSKLFGVASGVAGGLALVTAALVASAQGVHRPAPPPASGYPARHEPSQPSLQSRRTPPASGATTRFAGTRAPAGPRTAAAPKVAPLSSSERAIAQKVLGMPLAFEENRGQLDPAVKFMSRGPGYAMYFTPTQTVMALSTPPRRQSTRIGKAALLKMKLMGAAPNPRLTPLGSVTSRTNYLIGNQPSKWRTGIANYARLRYEAVYPGIDVEYYGNQRKLEYDFHVKPGADPKQIRIGFAGSKQTQIDANGDLVLQTGLGSVRQHRPVSYQVLNGVRKTVDSRYVLRGGHQVGIQLAKYDTTQPLVIDPVLSYSALVGGGLDEYGLSIKVHTDGTAYVTGYTESYDRPRNDTPNGYDMTVQYPVIPGFSEFPVTGGTLRSTRIGSVSFSDDLDAKNGNDTTFTFFTYDAFVFRMNATGSGLVYSTYVGSSADDYGTAITVDASGYAFATGMTMGTDFPMQNPVQAIAQGSGDGYLIKLNPAGSIDANSAFTTYLTYFSGGGRDYPRSIAVDVQGNCVIAGITTSTNLPVFRAAQPTFGGGGNDCFVANLNAKGTAFNYVTYLGGTGTEGGASVTHWGITFSQISITSSNKDMPPGTHFSRSYGPVASSLLEDRGVGVAFDSLGNAYVTSSTNSANFPTAGSPLKTAVQGIDAFVTEFSPLGAMVYSTLVGGTGNDNSRAIALDRDGNATIVGSTSSDDFPTTAKNNAADQFPIAVRKTGGTFGWDAFITTINTGGSAILYSTLYGGAGDEAAMSVARGSAGHIYVAGFTQSNDLPLYRAIQPQLLGGQDAFVLKLLPGGGNQEYSTLLGGLATDLGLGISIDSIGVAYVTGRADSAAFPNTVGAMGANSGWNPEQTGFVQTRTRCDVFVTRITNPPVEPTNLAVTAVGQTTIGLTWVDNSNNETAFEIERKQGAGQFAPIGVVGANILNFNDSGLIPNTIYSYRVRAVNAEGSSGYSNTVTVTTLPTPPAAPANVKVTTIDKSRLRVTFDDKSNNESTFVLQRRQTSNVPQPTTWTTIFTFPANDETVSPTITFDDSGLLPATTYEYRVRSQNTADVSAWVPASAVDPDGPGAPGTTLPDRPQAVPANLAAVATSNTTIKLDWDYTVPANDAVNGFKIERSDDNGVTFNIIKITTNATPQLPGQTVHYTFNDSALTPDKRYFYRVYAYNVSGDGTAASANTWTLKDPPIGTITLNLTLTNPTTVTLTWNDLASESGYQVWRSVNGGAFAQVGSNLAANTVTFQDTALTPNTQYTYQVRAFITNQGGNNFGPFSGTKTQVTPPSTPTSLAATPTRDTDIQVSWIDTNGAGSVSPVSWELQYSKDSTFGSGVTTITLSGAPGSSQTTTVTGLTASTQYFFRVRATNTGGSSAFTASVSATTLPPPPTAPAGLVVTVPARPNGITSLQIQFTDKSDNELGFVLERSTGNASNFAPVNSNIPAVNGQPNTINVTDSNLAPSTLYFYRVKAKGAGGLDSLYSNTSSATTLPIPPLDPTNLVVTVPAKPVGIHSLVLNWTDNTPTANSNNEVFFHIERSLTGDPASFAQIASVGSDATTYTDNTAEANTTYFYRVRAENTGGYSGYSNVDSKTTLPNIPGSPTNLTATVTSASSIHLAWEDKSDNEEGFVILRSTEGGSFDVLTQTGPGATSYDDTGLPGDTMFSYKVFARNPGGDSGETNVASATTPPNVPTNLSASTLDNRRIKLLWTDTSSHETGFRIERKLVGGQFGTVTTVGPDATSYTDTGLPGNTKFIYRVIATSNTFDSPPSNEADATTLPDPPAKPLNLVAVAKSQTQIDLTWSDSSDNEDKFEIERSLDNGATWTPLATVGKDVTTYQDKGLAPATPYTYRVRAVNAGGTSDYSNQVTTSTLPNPPSSATGLTATVVSNSQVNLTWADNSDNEGGFRVERRAAADDSPNAWSKVTDLGADMTSFQDTGLAGNTAYVYRVVAVNSGGEAPPSNEASALTLPDGPAAFSAQVISRTRIKLSWAQPTGASGFEIERKAGNGKFRRIVTLRRGFRAYTDQGLIPGTTYTYRIRAFNASGFSTYAGPVTRRTPRR